jgi:hypothetical protein
MKAVPIIGHSRRTWWLPGLECSMLLGTPWTGAVAGGWFIRLTGHCATSRGEQHEPRGSHVLCQDGTRVRKNKLCHWNHFEISAQSKSCSYNIIVHLTCIDLTRNQERDLKCLHQDDFLTGILYQGIGSDVCKVFNSDWTKIKPLTSDPALWLPNWL